MQLRFLEYFVALARERHFARAAEACHVTQPTLSSGIAALEAQLGRRLIVRDRRFLGLTPEGEAMLPWAQRMISDHEGLKHAIELESGALQGTLRLGAIPAAGPVVGHLARSIAAAHPRLLLDIRMMTSRQIEKALIDYELDAGVTYLKNEPLAQVRTAALYGERYVFATAASSDFGRAGAVSWNEAASAPLCLLHTGMQNRRILDAVLAARGLKVEPRATADNYISLLSMVEAAGFSSILPHSYASLIGGDSGIRLIEFADPAPANEIGLVVLDREPISALARVALAAAEDTALPSLFGSLG